TSWSEKWRPSLSKSWLRPITPPHRGLTARGAPSAGSVRRRGRRSESRMRDENWLSSAAWLHQLQRLGAWVINAGVRLLAIALLYWFARRLLTRTVDQLLPSLLNRTRPSTAVRESRVRTIGGLLKSAGHLLLSFIAVVMALKVLDLEVAPIV